MRIRTIELGLAAMLVTSCGAKDQEEAWLAPEIARHVVAVEVPDALRAGHEGPGWNALRAGRDRLGWNERQRDGRQPFWRRGTRELRFANDHARQELVERFQDHRLVMVTFHGDSPLAERLASDSRTLGFLPASLSGHGHALVDATDPAYRAELATQAHTSTHGFACGNVEVVKFLPLTDTSEITPPLYDETIALDAVTAMLEEPSQDRIEQTISTLVALGTRRHFTDTGLEASETVEQLFRDAGDGIPGLTIEHVSHKEYDPDVEQTSVIARIPGTDPAESETIVVIGAHLDSTNREGGALDAPGADDDASGIATLTETLRVLATSGARFKRTIEFHAYAAEEDGLIGSGDLASRYEVEQKLVSAMMQIDMNGWSRKPSSKTIYLVEDDTSKTLRRSLKDLLNTYLDGDYVEKDLDGGTSDHRSWTHRGFKAVFPFEDPDDYNKALHSVNDTLDTINNLPLSVRFTKLALAFLAHHAGLETAADEYQTKLAARSLSKDLKLAITKGEQEGFYAIGIGTPNAVASVEICRITAAGSTACTEERVDAVLDRVAGERKISAVETYLPLAQGDRLAIFGYDVDDRLAYHRAVRLEAKATDLTGRGKESD